MAKQKFNTDLLRSYGHPEGDRNEHVRVELERWRAGGGTGADLVYQLTSLYRNSTYQWFDVYGSDYSEPMVLAIEDYSVCAFPALLPLVRNLREELVAEVVRRGANIECNDDAGTPLVWAAMQARYAFSHAYRGEIHPDWIAPATRIAGMLLDAGANPNAHGHDGCSPLMHAAAASAGEMVAKLLAAGANVHHTGQEGRGALHEAATSVASQLMQETAGNSSTLRAVRLLLQGGANPNVRNWQGAAPLHEMAVHAHRFTPDVFEAVAALLVDAGADLELRNSSGMTPLLLAQQNSKGADVAVPALIAIGADTNVRTPFGVRLNQMGNPENKRKLKAALIANEVNKAMSGGGAESTTRVQDTTGVL